MVAQITSGKPAAAAKQVEPLSERELEVLRLAAHGLTNKAIAADWASAIYPCRGI
ncbi:MAG: hypothetical protein IPO34_15905 [Dehalococcoidia bacterium]|nr:hypothetical protein [Dehalococcoidia bacterium]